MDNEIDRKIDVTAILFLLVQNRHQTHGWTLIGSGADGLCIQECRIELNYCRMEWSGIESEWKLKEEEYNIL